MTLPENLNVYISALMFVLGAFFIALYLGMIVWTFKDIRSRSRDVLVQVLSALLVAVFTLPGLLIYTLLRPHNTLSEEYERRLAEEALLQELDQEEVCPNCQRQVEKDFIVCPHCHHQLKLRCVGCGRLLNPAWDVCPYCGLFREQPGEPVLDSNEEAPVAESTPGKPDPIADVSALAEDAPDLAEPDQDTWIDADDSDAVGWGAFDEPRKEPVKDDIDETVSLEELLAPVEENEAETADTNVNDGEIDTSTSLDKDEQA